MKKIKKNNGITLVALVITIIILLILAGVSISALGGENGIITQAIRAKEETESKQYAEQIELIKTELLLENRYKEPLTLAQLQDRLSPSKEKWVASIEPIMDKDIEKLKLVTKEGYIFYITGTTTEYKGKGEVVDTSALDREDVIQIEKIEEGTTTVTVRITDLSGVNYYTLKYKIGDQGEWQQINSGETVEVPHGETIFAKLVYGSSEGVEHKVSLEHSKPTIVAKSEDTTNLTRKTDKPLAELFEITWGSDGSSQNIEYIVTGNLTFKNTSFNSTEIENISELELGTYTVTCKIISPTNQTAEATKENVKITTLATTTVTNASNASVTAKAIYSQYDLAYFSDLVNGGQNTINGKIMQDIDLSNISYKVDGTTTKDISFSSIGNSTNKYKGTFDGNEKKINNIYINSSSSGKGLFGYIESALIKNVILENGEIKATYDVGGIVGNSNESNIEICVNNNTSVSSTGYIERTYVWWDIEINAKFSSIGGIVGYNYNTNVNGCINSAKFSGLYSTIAGIVGFNEANRETVITNCVNNNSFSKDIDTQSYGVAGISGENYGNITIENCINYGDIKTNVECIGGIAGEIDKGKINNCTNYGNITGSRVVGGITSEIAWQTASDTIVGELNNCTNYGDITGIHTVGGIIGKNEGNPHIDNMQQVNSCTNEGNIETTGYNTEYAYWEGKSASFNSSNAGGIVGRTSKGIVNLCKNKGTILTAGYDCLGGIVGYSCGNSTIKKCSNYANIEDTVTNVVGGIAGYTNICLIEECFNVGNITGKDGIGGIAGNTTYTTVQNCYNTGAISGNSYAGGIIGYVAVYKYAIGYEYLYNCYNLGQISGTVKDCWVAYCDYLTWDYLYTLTDIYEQVGDGQVSNDAGAKNWGTISGSVPSKAQMLNNLLNGVGEGKWTRDGTLQINNSYPYLVNNVPE